MKNSIKKPLHQMKSSKNWTVLYICTKSVHTVLSQLVDRFYSKQFTFIYYEVHHT